MQKSVGSPEEEEIKKKRISLTDNEFMMKRNRVVGGVRHLTLQILCCVCVALK